jgi:hypothetical protein
MKPKYLYYLIGLVITALVGLSSTMCVPKQPIEPLTRVDTIYFDVIHYVTDDRIVDSLLRVNDSLNERLFVQTYKLERISYYNDIAKNGNNITFLRGWINRVLQDEK